MHKRHVRQCGSCGRGFAESSEMVGNLALCPQCGSSECRIVAETETMEAALKQAKEICRVRSEKAA